MTDNEKIKGALTIAVYTQAQLENALKLKDIARYELEGMKKGVDKIVTYLSDVVTKEGGK